MMEESGSMLVSTYSCLLDRRTGHDTIPLNSTTFEHCATLKVAPAEQILALDGFDDDLEPSLVALDEPDRHGVSITSVEAKRRLQGPARGCRPPIPIA